MMAKSRRLPPVLPGEILREDLMTPLGLSINGLARDLRVLDELRRDLAARQAKAATFV